MAEQRGSTLTTTGHAAKSACPEEQRRLALCSAPMAMALLSSDGTLLEANRLALLLAPPECWSGAGRDGAGPLQRLLGEAAGGASRRLALLVTGSGEWAVAADGSSGACVVATAVRIDVDGPSCEALGALFHLTAAERRVAAGLLRGATPRELADGFSVSLHTIRSHLRNLFYKTGTRGQTDLVALAARVALLDPPG